MADRIKKEQKSKVMDILKKDYPFEKFLLGALGLFVLIMGVYLLQGDIIRINNTDLWIFDNATKIKIFEIFVVVLGAVAFLLAVYPFFVPSISEMKKVSWPTGKIIANHSARVFGFIIFLSLTFMLYDFVFRPVFKYLNSLGV